MKPPKKLFVIKKYVYATSIVEAIKKDKNTKVDDCYANDLPKDKQDFSPAIGFTTESERDSW